MKKIVLFLIITTSLFGVGINESLLKVHATLLPKISLMEYKFKTKLIDNTIKIVLVYKRNEYKSANSLKKKIITRYPNGIKSYQLNVTVVSYSHLNKAHANMYYFFPASKSDINNAVKYANREKALTFSYSQNDLNQGVMISVNIERKIKPILNLEAIKTNEIGFRPIFIDISTIFVKEQSSVVNQMLMKTFINFNSYLA